MAHPTDDIISAMRSPSQKDREVIQKAYDFAGRAHGNEKRKSGEPYIVHPHAIALMLAGLGMGRNTIVAGILHDTTEDTTTSSEEIEREFGKEIAFLVDGLTKYSKLKYQGLERHVESLRHLFIATAADIRVIIIKLTDRLHNMRTIKYLPTEKQHRIALDTMQIYVPVAERLGISTIQTELEDLAFQVLWPKEFEGATHFLESKKKQLESLINQDIKDLKKFFAESDLKKFRTEYRFKGAYSFHKKLLRKGSADMIYDTVALRVITPTVEDCYVALAIIHRYWRPIPGRIKDFIAAAKLNGYRSLHTTVITRRRVTVEIQIRTEQIHQEAQFGIASHFNYKTGVQNNIAKEWLNRLMNKNDYAPTVEAPQWLKELEKFQEDNPDYKSFEKVLKQDFFAERMFVFTPHGDVIDLPNDATPVDFAYSVHSAIGNTMTGAKVNGKLVSLDTKLKNGNVVEITTKDSARPNKKWLGIAKTASAKAHIRSALRKLEGQS